jgi:hypothetical protein
MATAITSHPGTRHRTTAFDVVRLPRRLLAAVRAVVFAAGPGLHVRPCLEDLDERTLRDLGFEGSPRPSLPATAYGAVEAVHLRMLRQHFAGL